MPTKQWLQLVAIILFADLLHTKINELFFWKFSEIKNSYKEMGKYILLNV